MKKLIPLCILLTLTSACSSTSKKVTIGPDANQYTNASKISCTEDKPVAVKNKHGIYLDIAIPTLDPGIPTNKYGNYDKEELDELGIWPNLRRMESHIYAHALREQISATGAFGSVVMTPHAGASADVYLLGEVKASTSEFVSIDVAIVDSRGEIIDSKVFAYRVPKHHYQCPGVDPTENSYMPVYRTIARWAGDEINKLSQEEVKNIQRTTSLRYAAMYMPEKYESMLETGTTEWNGKVLTSYNIKQFPAGNDKTFNRINAIRAKDDAFWDAYQDNIDATVMFTNGAYTSWQAESLPVAIAVREALDERNWSIFKSVLFAGAIVAISGDASAVAMLKLLALNETFKEVENAFKQNQRFKEESMILEELGRNADLALAPTVIKIDEEVVTLTGTLHEQYTQWQGQLRKIALLETTPNIELGI